MTPAGRPPHRITAALILAFLVVATLLAAPAMAVAPYRIGAGDRLAIAVFGQPALSGDALLQADGTVRLPRVGAVMLGGLTLQEAEALLTAKLKTALGLSDPDVSIGIASYRPIFIIGDVQTPGAYAFSPGMTLLHAVALAGGYHRAEPGDATARLEAGRLTERQQQLMDQLAISYVRLARFEAERDGAAAFSASSAAAPLVTPERLAALASQEAAIKSERQVSLDASIKTFDQRREQLNNEISALEAQRDAKLQLAASLRREQDSLKDLIDKGLIPSPRIFELERTVISTEADRREVEAYISRARREIVLADQAELNLRSDRQLDILNGIKGARDEIAQQQGAIAAVAAQIDVARAISVGQSRLPDTAGVSFDRPMVKRRRRGRFRADRPDRCAGTRRSHRDTGRNGQGKTRRGGAALRERRRGHHAAARPLCN